MPITREEYMQKYGTDPAAVQPVDDSSGGLKPDYFAKSIVTGVPTLVTDFINIPSTISDAAKAAWSSIGTEKTFGEEFQKNIMIDDAQSNIQKHFNDIAQSWKAQQPNMSDEEIQQGLAGYQKTKMFEDFMMEQKRGTHYLAAKAKDTVRKLLGDQRTEAQRSWTDDAGEIIGGALVPGPGWTSAGVRAATAGSKYLGPVLNSLPGRVALKTAELTTPVTMPYSGVNVAANAGVGIALNQGFRAAQGESTAFTPTKEDPAGVGTLAGITAAVGATALIIGAVKGRNAAILKGTQAPTHLDTTLQNTPVIDMQVRQGDTTGQTLISAGDPTQYGPTRGMDELSRLQQMRTTARNQYIDQGAAVTSAIRREHGIEIADDLERMRTSNSGSVLADAIPAKVSRSQQAVLDAEANMTPDQLRTVKQAHWMNSYSSDIQTTHDALLTQTRELADSLARGKTSPQRQAADRTKLAKLQDDLQRLINDDPSARLRLPTIPMARAHQMGNAFLADNAPHVVAYRDAVKAFNKEMLDLDVSSGRMSQEAADKLHARNPYYVQAKDDPFKGAVGADRMWQSVVKGIQNKLSRQSAGTGEGALSESPLRHLSLDVQPVRQKGDPETRITNAFDTTSTMKMYAQRTHVDHAHTVMRNEHLIALSTSKNGGPSDLVKSGAMRAIDNGQGGTWFTADQLRTPELRALLDKPNIVDQWEKGKVKLWEFGDPEYARALRVEPILLDGLMKGVAITNNMAKSFMTGRFAPWFAPVGAMYNMHMSVWTRHQSRAFGPLTSALHRWTPKWFAEQVGGRIPDYTALMRWPYDVVASFVELQAYHLTRPIARELTNIAPFAGLQKAVGPRTYQAMVNKMLKVAAWADNAPAATLYKSGATFGQQSVDNVAAVRTAQSAFKDKMPAPLRRIYQVYTDGIDSIWLAERRQYYTQNHAILSDKYKGNIPQKEIDKLIGEARTLAGDMSLVPASATMRNLETFFPYLTQAKLSTYHLMRHMGSRDTASFVIPRMMTSMAMMGSSIYLMTYWDDDARKAYWDQSEQERYKHIYVPTPQTAWEHFTGERPKYSRDKVYRLRVPPDFAAVIAGTTSMMQMMGMLPADATPKPIDAAHVGRVFFENLLPAMPALLQAAAAQSGLKIEPNSAETRGGNWVRNYQSMFRSGPEAESMTNLGQVSNTAALTMNALFGTLGGYVAQGADIMFHAAKYHPMVGTNNQMIPRQTPDFAVGLKAALTDVGNKVTGKLPDVPLLWQNKDKYQVTTPAWAYVTEVNNDIRAIVGMRNDAVGKATNAKRASVTATGGIPTQGITDVVLGQIAEDVSAWTRKTGAFGKLNDQYDQLRAKSRGLAVQYNIPQEQRQEAVNAIIVQQQEIKKQQQLAIQYAEQVIAAKYGMALKPLLKGRFVNMKTINELLRENIGEPAAAHADQQQAQ